MIKVEKSESISNSNELLKNETEAIAEEEESKIDHQETQETEAAVKTEEHHDHHEEEHHPHEEEHHEEKHHHHEDTHDDEEKHHSNEEKHHHEEKPHHDHHEDTHDDEKHHPHEEEHHHEEKPHHDHQEKEQHHEEEHHSHEEHHPHEMPAEENNHSDQNKEESPGDVNNEAGSISQQQNEENKQDLTSHESAVENPVEIEQHETTIEEPPTVEILDGKTFDDVFEHPKSNHIPEDLVVFPTEIPSIKISRQSEDNAFNVSLNSIPKKELANESEPLAEISKASLLPNKDPSHAPREFEQSEQPSPIIEHKAEAIVDLSVHAHLDFDHKGPQMHIHVNQVEEEPRRVEEEEVSFTISSANKIEVVVETRAEKQKHTERPKESGNAHTRDTSMMEQNQESNLQIDPHEKVLTVEPKDEPIERDSFPKGESLDVNILSQQTLRNMQENRNSLYTSVIATDHDDTHAHHAGHFHEVHMTEECAATDSFIQQDPILTSMNPKDPRTQSIQQERIRNSQDTAACNCTLI
mgnify:FL=1